MKYNIGYSQIEIKDSWNVIEIGGGSNPCERANVITNYESEENQQGKKIKHIDSARMINHVNVEDLSMFNNKSFDYSICVQTLEHVDSPLKACNELMRISKAGYIETPSELCEQLIGFPFHKWLIRIDTTDNNKLIFTKKENYSRMDDFFFNMFYKDNPARQEFINVLKKYYKQWIVCFEWNNSFKVEVHE